MRIVVVNAGSTSVKLRVVGDGDRVEGTADLGPPDEGLAGELGRFLDGAGDLDASAHRVVHGGERLTAPVVVDDTVRAELGRLDALAPLHNPPATRAIDALRRLRPELPAVACFDTAFHVDLPPEATTYAIPAAWRERWGVRRFGFHGLACEWDLGRAAQLLGRDLGAQRVVLCHLGGGASVTAVVGGRSVDTTMGFTPMEGLVMATRSGDLDPGALLYLLDRGVEEAELAEGVERAGGLLALTGGRTADMREVLEARAGGDGRAALAVGVFVHRLRAKIAAMAAAAGGLDVLVFSGGIGEHSAPIRSEVAAGLAWLGVSLDEDANVTADGDAVIAAPGTPVAAVVVTAREELVVAAACRRLLARTS